MPMPVEIVALLRPTITLVWDDDHQSEYAARDLRLRCKCAFCVEEMTRRPLLDPGSVPTTVCAVKVHIVGNYAMSVEWSDGHTTGIYNFRTLREDCPCRECTARRGG